MNSPHKGQWRGALMFSLICVWIKGWVNNREAGDLRRYRCHYDVIVMCGRPTNIWELACQKQVSRTGASYYIPQYVWDVITCHCHWIGLHPFKDYTSPSGHFSHKYLILTQMSTCMREVSWTHDSLFQKALSESWMFYGNYEDSAGSYQLAMAYVLVVLLTYFGGLFIILSRYRYTGSMTYTL